MSEFKFACPVCGQHISCEADRSGSEMECPNCFRKITVPQPPAAGSSKFILTASEVRTRPLPQAAAAPAPAGKNAHASNLPLAAVVVLFVAGAAAGIFISREMIFKPGREPAGTSANPSPTAPGGATTDASSGGGGNLALNKPAFASSQEAQNPVQNGNDGNSGTRWCAANGSLSQWWKVDLGATFVITNTRVLWEKNSIYRYKIEVSSDDTNWTMAVNQTANLTQSNLNSNDCSATGRYLRITVTGLQSGCWASFFELEAYGSGSGNVAGGAGSTGNSTH